MVFIALLETSIANMNIKMILSYKGTNYLGFQKTKEGNSIENELEKALFRILQSKIYLQVASRTDAGVHATYQVVSFFVDRPLDLQKLLRGLNALLPYDITILSLEKVPAFFHASLDAKKKTYRYFICKDSVQSPFIRKTSWHYCYKPLDIGLMKQTAKFFIGKKNFAMLTPKTYKNPFCTIEKIEIIEQKEKFLIEIIGDRFLYKMVRTLVGTLVNISSGKIPLNSLERIFERKEAGMTAPALGLFLSNIEFEKRAFCTKSNE